MSQTAPSNVRAANFHGGDAGDRTGARRHTWVAQRKSENPAYVRL
jgi:hypothetical protein